MKIVSDEERILELEYPVGSDDGVEGPKSGVVESDGARRHSPRTEGVAHSVGFVVIRSAVIPTQHQVIDGTRMVERGGCVHSAFEKWIGCLAPARRGSS